MLSSGRGFLEPSVPPTLGVSSTSPAPTRRFLLSPHPERGVSKVAGVATNEEKSSNGKHFVTLQQYDARLQIHTLADLTGGYQFPERNKTLHNPLVLSNKNLSLGLGIHVLKLSFFGSRVG